MNYEEIFERKMNFNKKLNTKKDIIEAKEYRMKRIQMYLNIQMRRT